MDDEQADRKALRERPAVGSEAKASKDQDYIEEQAWNVKADGAFTGDLLGMIAEILVHMMQRSCNGDKLGVQDKEILKKILKGEDGKEGLAGTMAKVATPKEKVGKTGESSYGIDWSGRVGMILNCMVRIVYKGIENRYGLFWNLMVWMAQLLRNPRTVKMKMVVTTSCNLTSFF